MQFTVIALLASFAASTSSAPTANGNMSEVVLQSIDYTTNGCAAVKCALALGPTIVGCTVCAIQLGVNPVDDAFCIAMGLNAAVNVPNMCANCSTAPSANTGASNSTSSNSTGISSASMT